MIGRKLIAGPLSLLAAFAATLASRAAEAQDLTVRVGAGSTRPDTGTWIAFAVLAGLTLGGALCTITRRNPVTAAIWLVGTLFSSAGLYLLLHATFLAVIQVLVYAGAIMVLFVMVVMAVEEPEHEESGLMRGTVSKLIGVAALAWLLFRVISVMVTADIKAPGPVGSEFGTVRAVGRLLFSDYLFAFEAVSILLLTSVVGAVMLTRRRADTATEDETAKGGGS